MKGFFYLALNLGEEHQSKQPLMLQTTGQALHHSNSATEFCFFSVYSQELPYDKEHNCYVQEHRSEQGS